MVYDPKINPKEERISLTGQLNLLADAEHPIF